MTLDQFKQHCHRVTRCPCCDKVGCALFQRLKKQHLSVDQFALELLTYHPDLCGHCGRERYVTPGPVCRDRRAHTPVI